MVKDDDLRGHRAHECFRVRGIEGPEHLVPLQPEIGQCEIQSIKVVVRHNDASHARLPGEDPQLRPRPHIEPQSAASVSKIAPIASVFSASETSGPHKKVT